MANVDAFEDVSLETGDFEEFHYETQYVVLNYLGMVPPVLELGSQDGDESDGDKPDDEDYTTKSSAVGTEKSHQEDQRSPSTPDSQLLVGRLELEEPKMTSEEELVRSEIEESYLTHYNADESEAEQCGVSPSLESLAGSSNVSHGTPILIVEQYMESIQCYHRERLERRSNNTNLTTLVMPLREEVCHHLDTLDERRGCVSPRIWALSPSLDTQEPPPPPSPEAIIASRIAAIGDQIMLEHQNHTELNSAVKKLLGHNGTLDYNAFKEVAKDMIDTEEPSSGWHQIASVLNFSRHVALSLMRKGQRIGQLTEYSVKLIEENMANFIVDQGGWEAVSRINIEDYSSSDLHSTTSEFSLPMSPWPEGTLLTPPVFRKSSGSDVSDPGSGPPSPSWKDYGQTYHIPGRPHRLGASNLLTPGNFRMLPSNQGMSVSGEKEKDDVTIATDVQDASAAVDTWKDENDSGRVDVSTQTFFTETDNSDHSGDSDADNGDVVASLFGFPGDSDSDSDSQRSPTRFKGRQQEVSTQTKKKSWFSVSSAAALAIGVGVGIAVMKK